jgi:hypothetical protein
VNTVLVFVSVFVYVGGGVVSWNKYALAAEAFTELLLGSYLLALL